MMISLKHNYVGIEGMCEMEAKWKETMKGHVFSSKQMGLALEDYDYIFCRKNERN